MSKQVEYKWIATVCGKESPPFDRRRDAKQWLLRETGGNVVTFKCRIRLCRVES